MKKLIYVLAAALVFSFSATAVMADPGPYDTTECADDNGGAIFSPCEAGNGFDVFNAINQVFIDAAAIPANSGLGLSSPGYAKNEDADSVQVIGQNELWKDLSTEDASDFAFISITAGNNNTLGIFPEGDTGSATFFPPSQTGNQFLGDGSSGDPYPGAINTLSTESFGFALKTDDPNNGEDIWYSDVSENSDGIDHMLAYWLPGLAGAEIWIEVDAIGDDGVLDTNVKVVLTSETYLLAWEDKDHANDPDFDGDYNDSIFLVTKVQPIPEPMSMLLLGSGLAALAGTRRRKRA